MALTYAQLMGMLTDPSKVPGDIAAQLGIQAAISPQGQQFGQSVLNEAGQLPGQIMNLANSQVGSFPQAQASGPTMPQNIPSQQNTKADPQAIAAGKALNASKPSNGTGYSQYKVKSGDTLWGIAQQQLGDGNRWHELEGFHGDPHALQPGTIIHVPGQTQGQTPKPATPTMPKSQSLGPAPSNVSSSAALG